MALQLSKANIRPLPAPGVRHAAASDATSRRIKFALGPCRWAAFRGFSGREGDTQMKIMIAALLTALVAGEAWAQDGMGKQ